MIAHLIGALIAMAAVAAGVGLFSLLLVLFADAQQKGR